MILLRYSHNQSFNVVPVYVVGVWQVVLMCCDIWYMIQEYLGTTCNVWLILCFDLVKRLPPALPANLQDSEVWDQRNYEMDVIEKADCQMLLLAGLMQFENFMIGTFRNGEVSIYDASGAQAKFWGGHQEGASSLCARSYFALTSITDHYMKLLLLLVRAIDCLYVLNIF